MEKKASLTLKAEDIPCSACAEDMEKVLRESKGILDARVIIANSTIDIIYDPYVLNEKKVFYAVRKLGFKTKIVRNQNSEG